MVELEIDGKPVSVEEGASIIEAAEKISVHIPRFCYHSKLSVAANCRMCLVEVEKSRKPLPACATPVTPGMKVFTTTDMALEAQRGVMEYLLINHPLDCPICDQGGECELQDLAMGYGTPYSYYEEPKRSVFSENIGPLIETEMTRCIQCTRCVRFGEEIGGMRELGVISRGGTEEIGTYVKHFMRSEISANIIDVCPVGALTAKPIRYMQRGWEMLEFAGVAPHDCVGSNLYLHMKLKEFMPQRELMRIVPRENEAVNDVWISDRDRFGFLGLRHAERVFKPMIKRGDEWLEVDWPLALEAVVQRTQRVLDNKGASQLAGLASPNATVEEFYLLQKLLRGLGSDNVDFRLRQLDFSDQDTLPLAPTMSGSLADLEDRDAFLLIGSDVRREQPMFNHRINQATQNDAVVMAINPIDYEFNYDLVERNITGDLLAALQQLLDGSAIMQRLQQAQTPTLILGAFALHHPQAATIRQMAQQVAAQVNGVVIELTDGANAAGAWYAGAVPHRTTAGHAVKNAGRNAQQLLSDQPADGYFLLNVEPELDSAYPAQALQNLRDAALVVCVTNFANEAMYDYADIILPAASFAESGGTYINVTGDWQTLEPTSLPYEHSRAAWQILTVVGSALELEGFHYKKREDILHDVKVALDNPAQISAGKATAASSSASNDLLRISAWPMYCNDPMVRRSQALQDCLDRDVAAVRINSTTAEKLGLSADRVLAQQGEQSLNLPLILDDHLADNVVLLPFGLAETAGFGAAMMKIELSAAQQEGV